MSGKKSKAQRKQLGQSARQIVKVQLSVTTTAGVRQILVYNQNRSWSFEGPAQQDMITTMGPRLKAFFWARKEGPMLDIDTVTPCPEQTW